MKRLISTLLLACWLTAASAAEPLIFIARHAEKSDAAAGDPRDPELSPAGHARAESLAHALRDAGITAIFATEFKRTQQTAEPLARAAHVEVAVVAAKESAALIARLREQKSNVLVIGHSNTIGQLLKALGIDAPPAIGDADYDNLFVVSRDPAPRLLRLHY
jgi:broad specificity phosphatase PhoE